MSRYTELERLANPLKGNIKYPDLPLQFSDFYVTTTVGDRFDILAQQYYSDPTLWWVISIANPHLPQNSYYPPIGEQIRIPQNIAEVIQQYKDLNSL
jgi:hypothetical protein|tara:strand:- start:4646 stop:4936 length:291 start_codon:yes stop_codon:yes gene_type:complete